jgi:hypothetical protein
MNSSGNSGQVSSKGLGEAALFRKQAQENSSDAAKNSRLSNRDKQMF